ncbi:hypothetical protein ACFQ05_17445 [Amycolatopsis umgeniensis]|uniref:Uncharacterized protein n=1 Tax=Amycolatopsis umgeniensis TaxID=336628 RepID=A0A841B942_9PSEU|nr:hypothetical protein [Amycolatopsis umgeniensis]
MHATAFRYRPPVSPVAAATVEIGKVAISLRLSFDGALYACRRPPGVVERMEAEALDLLSKGLFVSGIDTPVATVTGEAGHRFVQESAVFEPPDGWLYRGMCGVGARRNGLSLTGIVGYRLEVRARWARRAGDCGPPETAAEWCELFGGQLASIGGVVLRRASVLSLGTPP